MTAVTTLVAGPQVVAAARPDFKLPFACGESYIGYTYRGHGYAIDFDQSNNSDHGDPVLASAAGVVTETRYATSNGQITISHGDGWQTKYAHMRGVTVRLHDKVPQGHVLGYVDDVGNATVEHLHFEQDLNGVRVRSRFDGDPYYHETWVKSTNGCASAKAGSDPTPPQRTAPDARFVVGTKLALSGPSVPVTNTWAVSDAGSGIAYSVLQRKVDGGSYETLSTSTRSPDTSHTAYTRPGETSTFTHRVRATDEAGNVSSYATGSAFKVRRRQDDAQADVTYAGPGWKSVSDASRYSGGSVRHASSPGNRAVLAFTGHDFAIAATTGPAMGQFAVYADGVSAGVVNLYRPTHGYRTIVWQRHFTSAASRTIELRVLGTRDTRSSGTSVELDAFLVLQP